PVHALAVFDDDGPGPSPPALYAGGDFTEAGGLPARGLARWDGSAWSAVATGFTGTVRAICPATSDSIAGLYIGGTQISLDGTDAGAIVRWDGAALHTVGNGVAGQVFAMTEAPNLATPQLVI